MRVAHPLLSILSLCLVMLGSVKPAPAQDRDKARRHLQTGVALYNQSDYAAALVEFEASMQQLASAAALQNIALCQTKLFRYVPAIETLENLRSTFAESLTEHELQQLDDAIGNLSQLIATVTLRITPPTAKVTLSGEQLAPQQWKQPLRLSSGTYQLHVAATNYVPVTRTIKVAGGQQHTVDIELTKTVGTLSVRTNDQRAAIALDRTPLAYGAWSGQVLAGEHLVQVYKQGRDTAETLVPVRTGDDIVMQLAVGQPEGTNVPHDSADHNYAQSSDHVGLQQRLPFEHDNGLYGQLSAALVATLRSPQGFSPTQTSNVLGNAFGIRGGYRLNNYVGLEGLIDVGSHKVSGSFHEQPSTYELWDLRFGSAWRALWGGKTARLSASVGLGAVWHQLTLAGIRHGGLNSFVALDAGVQFNVGNALIEGFLIGYLDGTTAVRNAKQHVYSKGAVLPIVGFGIRMGVGQWSN